MKAQMQRLRGCPQDTRTETRGGPRRAQAAREAEAEAVRERIAAALGTRVSDRKLGDLMRLAHFQMLGRGARAWRSPTAILARRPLRAETLRRVGPARTNALLHSQLRARLRVYSQGGSQRRRSLARRTGAAEARLRPCVACALGVEPGRRAGGRARRAGPRRHAVVPAPKSNQRARARAGRAGRAAAWRAPTR